MKISEEKIEDKCNKMVAKGKMPGFIFMNKKTLTALAKEIKPGERVVKSKKRLILKPNTFTTSAYHVYFRIDDTMVDGKIRLEPMDEKYFKYEKELRKQGRIK